MCTTWLRLFLHEPNKNCDQSLNIYFFSMGIRICLYPYHQCLWLVGSGYRSSTSTYIIWWNITVSCRSCCWCSHWGRHAPPYTTCKSSNMFPKPEWPPLRLTPWIHLKDWGFQTPTQGCDFAMVTVRTVLPQGVWENVWRYQKGTTQWSKEKDKTLHRKLRIRQL